MSLIKLATSFPELRKVAFNLVHVTILDCNGVLAGTQGLDIRYNYPEFYDYYREVIGDKYSDATSSTELLGSVIYGSRAGMVKNPSNEIETMKNIKEPIIGIFGTCSIITKKIQMDETPIEVNDPFRLTNTMQKFDSVTKCELNEDAIRKGIKQVNEFINDMEWNHTKVLTYPCMTARYDGKQLLEILEDIYECNDQFQVIATNEKIGEW